MEFKDHKLSLKTAQKLCQNLNKLAHLFFTTFVLILKTSLNNLQATLTTLRFSFFTEITAVPTFKDWCLNSSHNKVNEHSNPEGSFGKTNWKAENMHHLSCYVLCCIKKKLFIWTQVSHLICPSGHPLFLWNDHSLIFLILPW